ncbi:MAG: Idiomarinaceae phage, partial [Pseudomonadota bacterium]
DIIDEWIGYVKNGFLELPQNIKAFVQLASVEFAALVVDVEIYGRKIANFLNPMSPTYNLQQNLDASVKIYQESIEAILAERDKVTKQASERKDKAQNDRALDNLLGDWNKEYNTGDRLEGFGGKKKDTKEGESDKDKKAKEKAAKQFEQLKEQAQKELNVILEKNMSEQELEQKRYNEAVSSLDKHLKDKAITTSQYLSGIIALNEQADKKTTELMIAQHETEKAINDKNAEEDFTQHAARLEQLGILMDGVRQGGMTELEIMDEQHAQKMQKLTDLAMAEADLQGVINGIKLEAEAQYQAKRLDLMLGTGNKMQKMSEAFQKGNLQGALSFFAADFGGMSQHSRKMFELTKAARLAEAAMLVPSSVLKAYEFGSGIGGPIVGAAFGAAALATQLGNLRAIQSASFGGGGSSGSSGGSGGGVSMPSSQGQQEQAPLQQRFVNIGLSGSDNTMYTKDSVRELIKRLNEEVKDGAVLRVN